MAFVASLLCGVVLLTSCGAEAPPRAALTPPGTRSLLYSTTPDPDNHAPSSGSALRPDAATPTPIPAELQPHAGDPRSLGDPNAPVVIVMYSDFQCPFCARFERDVIGAIQQQYVQTGKALLVFRDFPAERAHPGALAAALAARCAAEQGAFWPMHAALFGGFDRNQWSGGQQDALTFLGYAQQLKLDTDAFSACVAAERYVPQIRNEAAAGARLGVYGTPTFFINGRIVVGARSASFWQKAIEQQLAGK